MSDQQITCSDCGGAFVFTQSEQQFYATKGLSGPKRCKTCRLARKASAEGGGGGGGGDARGPKPGGRGGYDFAFVDADKGNYIAYYEKLLELVRPGGLIAVDNTLGLSGQYITYMTTPGAQAIRAFNAHVHHDARVELSLLPIGEGLTLLRVL